MLRREVRL